MRTWRPDVVHLHTAMPWYVAEAIQRATRAPIVYHVHSVDRAEYEIGQEPNQWLAHSHAQEAAIAAADRLIAISRSEHDLLVRYYPHCRGRITTVGNGIGAGPALFNPRSYRRYPKSGPVVLYSGRLVERKGIRDLAATIPRVLQAAPSTRFVLAGGPPGVPGCDLARECLPPEVDDLAARVHFTGWLSPRDWYQAADVLVVPSRYEPFGMVVLEGMLHALPIIACDSGGPGEILEHDHTGLLFPPKDRDRLTAHIIALVQNPTLRSRLGRERCARRARAAPGRLSAAARWEAVRLGAGSDSGDPHADAVAREAVGLGLPTAAAGTPPGPRRAVAARRRASLRSRGGVSTHGSDRLTNVTSHCARWGWTEPVWPPKLSPHVGNSKVRWPNSPRNESSGWRAAAN